MNPMNPMSTEDFTRILFTALSDPDGRIAELARGVKAAIEAGDLEAANTGVEKMTERMKELSTEDPDGERWRRRRVQR